MDHHLHHNVLHKLARRDYTTIDGTVMSVAYTTPSPTFTGSVAGYSTAPVSVTQTQSNGYTSSTTWTTSAAPSYTAGAITPESLPAAPSNGGMSTGGRVGLAIVIILIIGGILGFTLWFNQRKKRANPAPQTVEDAEKDMVEEVITPEPFIINKQPDEAPKLTLRPASSFLPDLLNFGKRKSRLSQGDLMGSTTERNPVREQYLAAIGKGQDIPMSEKSRPTENPFTDPEDPFADPVKRSLSGSGSDSSSQSTLVGTAVSPTSTKSSPELGAGVRSPTQPAFVIKPQNPEPVEMPSASVPAPLQTGRAASNSITNNDNNAYRVLMDFVPSMNDELELSAGQVVRMLHEYDDGWCLATRLDRSKQGVVPRTCLAAKPSKPRAQDVSRSASPAMRIGPQVTRPMSPATAARTASKMYSTESPPLSPGAYNQPPRPLSPGPRAQQKRSMSPGPAGPPKISTSRRSSSASSRAREVQEKRASPPGPSKLGPGTPGMAM